MATIAALYVGYMIAISSLDRVMYLYHYFIPLTLSFILLGYALINIERMFALKMNESARLLLLTLLALSIFGSFLFYRPLTYYEPLTKEAFQKRAIIPLWELSCTQCDKKSGLVIPRS